MSPDRIRRDAEFSCHLLPGPSVPGSRGDVCGERGEPQLREAVASLILVPRAPSAVAADHSPSRVSTRDPSCIEFGPYGFRAAAECAGEPIDTPAVALVALPQHLLEACEAELFRALLAPTPGDALPLGCCCEERRPNALLRLEPAHLPTIDRPRWIDHRTFAGATLGPVES